MDKGELSGRIDKEILEKVWAKFPGTKTESYKAALLASLDCDTLGHTPPLALDDSVIQIINQRIEALERRDTRGHGETKGLENIVTQIDTLQQEMEELHQQMRVVKDELKVIKEASGFV